MNRFTRGSLVLLCILLTTGAWTRRDRPVADVYARVSIERIGLAKLTQIKQTPGLRWWVECDRSLLVCARPESLRALTRMAAVERLNTNVDESRLVFVSLGHGAGADRHVGDVLARCGRFAVVQLYRNHTVSDIYSEDAGSEGHVGCQAAWMPFAPNTVLASALENQAPLGQSKALAEIQELVDAVDGARYMADIAQLASWSRVSGSTGNNQAGEWLFEQFSRLPGMSVRHQNFTFNNTRTTNIVATLRGKVNTDDVYLIGAHYDSTASRDGAAFAPGAEDNASGTAAVLEMARILSVFRPNATFMFVCYSGEEQGLRGSIYQVARFNESGLNTQLKAVCIMDMIAYSSDADLDVLLETGGEGIPLLNIWSDAATLYTNLRVVTSTNPFGSDHVPFINDGVPALLTIENEYETYPGYHRGTDTFEKVTEAMGVETIKMNLAAIAGMSGYTGFSDPVVIMTP